MTQHPYDERLLRNGHHPRSREKQHQRTEVPARPTPFKRIRESLDSRRRSCAVRSQAPSLTREKLLTKPEKRMSCWTGTVGALGFHR
jgi:hypothetical protein